MQGTLRAHLWCQKNCAGQQQDIQGAGPMQAVAVGCVGAIDAVVKPDLGDCRGIEQLLHPDEAHIAVAIE